MSKDLVSVIIPSYNHAHFIEQALFSVADQKYRPLEIVIIDDGSRDGSPEKIASLLPALKRKNVEVRFIARENRGAHVTINEALALAKGQWLTILNSDDYYLPGRIQKLMAKAKSSRSEFLFTRIRHVGDDGKIFDGSHPFRAWYELNWAAQFPTVGFRLLRDNIVVTTGNFFFSRALYEAIGGFRNFVLIHDYDFVLRALAFTEPALVEDELLAYRIHATNTISDNSHLNIEEGPLLAFDFIVRTLQLGEPRNHLAPWARANARNYEQYWKSSPVGALRNWLGTVDLSGLYEKSSASRPIDSIR